MSLASVWPWALAAAILGIVICFVIAVIVLRTARAKVPMIPASAAPPQPAGSTPIPATTDAGVAAALGIRRSFAEAHRALKQQTTSLADRTSIPWVLSIGEVGAGKSTLIHSLDIPRLPGVAAHGEADHVPAVEWAFFEHGIVIDAAGSLVLDPSRPHADDRAWRALLGQLNRYRPERPLDAVVVSIPCTDLVGPQRLSRDALSVKATKLGDRIAELQHTLSLRLPVYVVVTKCDTIPGFTAFCHAMTPRRLDDMLGWSSPYTVDSAFIPTWVDEALDSVLRGLQEAEFAALAREDVPTDGDALFLLPLHLGRTRSPLRDFLQRIFRPTTYERGAFLRGIYFTGDRSARAEADEPTSATSAPIAAPTGTALGDPWVIPAEETVAPVAIEAPRRPAFVADLFKEKIFAERGLAQPGARVFPSKNKLVARMQIAAAAIVLLSPFTLYGAVNGFRIGPWRMTSGIKAEAASMLPLLQNIDVAVHEMASRRDMFRNASNEPDQQHVSVFQLLDNMASMRSNHMWSVFLPGTLLSPLHRDITDAIGLSFQTIILPEFHDRLVYRAKRLIDPNGTKPISEDPQYGVGISLPQYLQELSALSQNVDHFNQLAEKDRGELEDLASIVQYLYGEQMAPEFLQDAGYYRQALSEANTKPVQIDSAARFVALRRAGELTRESYTALLRRLTGTQMLTDSGSITPTAGADIAALTGLRAFLDTAGPVEHSLDGIHPPFAFGDQFAARVRDTLTFYTGQLTGQLLPRYTDAAHSSEAIIHALDELLRQPFMQAPASKPLSLDATAGAELSWDPARLDDALALRAGFNTFMAHGLDPLPEVLRNRVRGLATMQLGAAMTDAIASAARLGSGGASFADREHDLESRVAAFDQSAPRLSQLLDQLDSIGATTTYDALLDATTVNAAALLARVDAQLDLANRYRLPATAVAAWNGRAPFTTNGFAGRPGAFDAYFAGEQDAMHSAAKLARPLVTFLDEHDDASRRGSNLRTWETILTAVDGLEKKPVGGPIVAMQETLRLQLDSIDVRDCARRSPRPSTGTDLFAQRADAMWSAVWRRCVDVANRELSTSYGRLQSMFRTRLAGRFPFAPADAHADASPADIAEFLRTYDAFVSIAKESGPADAPFSLLGTRADVFLTDIGRVRALFAAYLDSAAAGRPPLLDYQIDFRVNRAHESGANQIAEWTADIGDQEAQAGAPVAARRGRWRAGDDIQVTLRWATGSPIVPAPPAPDGATLGDGSVTFDASGEWSLLRLLRRYESDTPDPDGGATLKFTVPTGRRGSSAGASSGARAYVRVRLYNPDTKTELAMPRFPVTAPDLGGSR